MGKLIRSKSKVTVGTWFGFSIKYYNILVYISLWSSRKAASQECSSSPETQSTGILQASTTCSTLACQQAVSSADQKRQRLGFSEMTLVHLAVSRATKNRSTRSVCITDIQTGRVTSTGTPSIPQHRGEASKYSADLAKAVTEPCIRSTTCWSRKVSLRWNSRRRWYTFQRSTQRTRSIAVTTSRSGTTGKDRSMTESGHHI